MVRRLLICLAFATWCFLDTWVEYGEGDVAYFARQDPVRAVAIPVLCLEVILALTLWGVWELCRVRRLDRALPLHYLFLGICLAPAGIVSVALLRAAPFHFTALVRGPLFWPAALIAALVPFGWACVRPRSASRLMGSILLFSWPVLILVLIQAARGTLARYPGSAYADRPLALPVESNAARTRVVWIVFDELSQTIAFDNRPTGLDLPNFDRLKGGSFWAAAAESPGDSTEISMPSLILGEPVIRATPQGPDDLRVLTRSSRAAADWRSMPNVFDTARELGANTALVGWFHPYGRLLNRSLTKCYWTAGWLLAGVEERSNPQSLFDAMGDRVRFQLAALPLIGHLPGVFPGIYHRQEKIERFSWLRARAIETVLDPAIGLVLIHLPVPHPPAIYSRTEKALTAQGRIGYVDSVALADQTLGALRRALEEAGLWDRTALIVSADHGWRTSLWRGDAEWTPEEEAVSHQDTVGVPFIVRLPGQIAGVVYAQRFNTIVTREIVTGILSGRLTDPNQLAEWIERSMAVKPL